jgi:hypothetical protein
MTIVEDLHALRSIFLHLAYEADEAAAADLAGERRCGREDMSWQIDWLERYIERLKATADVCPRCDGKGVVDWTYCIDKCRACAGTGAMTKQDWDDWCDRLKSAPTLAQQLGKRCPDCDCGATEQDWKQAGRCRWSAVGVGLSIPVHPDSQLP